METSQKRPYIIQYGYFRNRDDAQRLEINYRRHLEIQDDNFRFMENSLPIHRKQAILKSKMANSSFWKTAQFGQIPSNMSIFGIGMTPRGRESTPDAILKSKMANSGFWKTAKNGYTSCNMGISGTGMTSRGRKSTTDTHLYSRFRSDLNDRIANLYSRLRSDPILFARSVKNRNTNLLFDRSYPIESNPIGNENKGDHLEIQDDNFGFMENSLKNPKTIHYGYYRNRDNAQRSEIDLISHFEIQDGNFRFLELPELA